MLEWLKPKDMQTIVSLLEENFDYVLIDCPAGIEDGFKNAASAAREAVVVTTPEVAAVRDADRVIGLLNTRGVSPVPLLGLVFEDEQVIVSTNRGEPLTLGDGSSPAALAYNNIARRLQGDDIPLMDPSQARLGLRARMKKLMQTRIF